MSNEQPVKPQTDLSLRPILLGILSIILSMSVIIGIVSTRGRMMDMFEEFEIEMPAVTTVALHPLLPILLAVAMFLTLIFLVIPNAFSRKAAGGLLIFSSLVLVVYLFGVFTPLMKLIEALS